MNSNEKSKILVMKRTIMIACLLAGVTSCNGFKEADSIAVGDIVLNNPDRDTVFSIANQKLCNTATVTLEGTLSDTCIIRFSTDNLIERKATFFVTTPKKVFSETINLSDIKSDSLFIKYHPLRSSVSGDVKIAVNFL